MKGLWHHISESNWINFVVVGVVAWYAWTYVQGLKNDLADKDRVIQEQEKRIANARLESEVNAMTAAEIAMYFETRLDNLEKSKRVADAVWKGVRKVEY